MSALTDIVSVSLNAASKIANEYGEEALQRQLQAYGLAVDGLSAAAGSNPEAAVAGVIAGVAVVSAAAPLTATAVTGAVAATGLTGAAAAAYEIGLTVAAEYGISNGAAKLTEDVIGAVASVLNTSDTYSAVNRAFAAYGAGEIETAQLQLQQSDALLTAAGQALSSVGESLYSDFKSIGAYFGNLITSSQNASGTETLIVNDASTGNFTSMRVTFTTGAVVQSATSSESNGTSLVDTYNPNTGAIASAFNLNASGVDPRST